MLKSTWLNLVLNMDLMTLHVLKLEFFLFLFLEFIVYLRSPSQNFVENLHFDVILSYFRQILVNYLFDITYLHTTCIVF